MVAVATTVAHNQTHITDKASTNMHTIEPQTFLLFINNDCTLHNIKHTLFIISVLESSR
jgi:hypothetical protein